MIKALPPHFFASNSKWEVLKKICLISPKETWRNDYFTFLHLLKDAYEINFLTLLSTRAMNYCLIGKKRVDEKETPIGSLSVSLRAELLNSILTEIFKSHHSLSRTEVRWGWLKIRLQNHFYISGWGTTSFGGPTSKVLMETTLNVKPISECQAVFGEVTDRQLCTYGKNTDACQVGTDIRKR